MVVLHLDVYHCAFAGHFSHTHRYVCCAVHVLYQAYWPQFAPKKQASGLSADELQAQYGQSLKESPLADAGSPYLLHKSLTQRLGGLTAGDVQGDHSGWIRGFDMTGSGFFMPKSFSLA